MLDRLRAGEAVYIRLEETTGMALMNDAAALRTYWSQWKKGRLFLSMEPDGDKWLDDVGLSFHAVDGRGVMQLLRKSRMLAFAQGQVQAPNMVLVLTGRGMSIAHATPKEIPPEAAAEVAAKEDNALRWTAWVGHRDLFEHIDQFQVPFDDPAAVEYRAKYGG